MEVSSQEGEIPMPINTSYGHGHIIHHDSAPQNHIIPTSAPQMPSNGPTPTNLEGYVPYKRGVKYRECLKNHAAAMGGSAVDGCGEFMPSGEEGTLEALICSACNCHRNFHRKEVEGSGFHIPHLNRVGRKVIMGHHKNILGPKTLGYYPTAQAHQVIMPYNVGSIPSESDEQEDGGGGFVARAPPQLVKKRFRTKFTTEQKEKMMEFAEKVGWKIQRQEENVVQQLCQEIGIKRRVLKVWMHNNKHNLAKKNPSLSTPENPI
ncbi:hypothetical protein Vadar_007307 [Vaccinium darrowii]|uniref:Uncharacterized protein n=1 Tax=Vaccinium darrowii TaxID=229202 RepID=A0ACB7ZHZ5_9ERIC|nr:hypothetical protein Vadar_007307 [Vaccinium darrowii]